MGFMKLIVFSAPLSGGEGEGVESSGCACAFLTAPTSSQGMRLGLGAPVPQSPLNASDLQMWGVGPPQCTPCISSPATGGGGQDLLPSRVGFRLALGSLAGSAWQGHGCWEPWLCQWVWVLPGQVFVQGEARRVQTVQLQQQPLLRNVLGVLLCMGFSECAGAQGSAVTSSDSLLSPHTSPVALAGSKLPFRGAAVLGCARLAPQPPGLPRFGLSRSCS